MSNGCATTPSVLHRSFVAAIAALTTIFLTAGLAGAQETTTPPDSSASTSEHPVTSAAKFLAGGAVGLAAHETGHLIFDGIFSANPGIKKVDFHGFPFFAITHDAGLTPRKEFIIDSAGFWVQEATNEILLSRRGARPSQRHGEDDGRERPKAEIGPPRGIQVAH